MTPERWDRIQALYHAARVLPEGDRRRFLGGSCEGDPALGREVQKLLDQPVSTGSFIEFLGDAAPAQPASATRQDLTGSAAWRLPRHVLARARRDGGGLPRA